MLLSKCFFKHNCSLSLPLVAVKMPWKGEEKGEALFLRMDWNEVRVGVNAFRKGVGAFVYQMFNISFGKY